MEPYGFYANMFNREYGYFTLYRTQITSVCDGVISLFLVLLRFAFKRAVSERTFYVSKRTFAVSERIVFPRDMSCLGDEIDMFVVEKECLAFIYYIYYIKAKHSVQSAKECQFHCSNLA